MEVNDALFDRLAKLSRLKFTGEERVRIKAGLENMIGMAEKLNEVNTEHVEPLLHISGNVNIMRNDIAEESMGNGAALKNAAQKNAPYFIVPKMIKK